MKHGLRKGVDDVDEERVARKGVSDCCDTGVKQRIEC